MKLKCLIITLFAFTYVVDAREDTDVEKKFGYDSVSVAMTDTVIKPKKKKGLFGGGNQKDMVKKGISFGPLPVIAFDADKGFQYGALLNIYDFGDGSHYPHPRQQWYIEASAYTKGTQQYFITYDTKHLIPHTRMSIAATCVYDKAMDFYGYNGYQSFYNVDSIQYWKKQHDKTGIKPEFMKTFYRVERLQVSAKVDFVGNIWHNRLFWQAGYYFSWTRMRPINLASINKGKDSIEHFTGQTLFEKYQDWGIVPNDNDGGFTSAVRAGIMWDSRDFEAAPSRGIWAEANIFAAPEWLGTTHPYYRYMVIFRHYVPIVDERLVFAYRLNYMGTIGKSLPYYVAPVYSTIGREYDRDGIGGYRTVRGLSRDRVMALDAAFFNAELRWRFVKFVLWRQNVAFALNAFCDGAIAVRYFDMEYKGDPNNSLMLQEYNKYIDANRKDGLHAAAGGGLRVIINRNFIIAFEYAMPFNRQDGTGSFYLNTGYLF